MAILTSSRSIEQVLPALQTLIKLLISLSDATDQSEFNSTITRLIDSGVARSIVRWLRFTPGLVDLADAGYIYDLHNSDNVVEGGGLEQLVAVKEHCCNLAFYLSMGETRQMIRLHRAGLVHELVNIVKQESVSETLL